MGRENQSENRWVDAVASARHQAGGMRMWASWPGHGPVASVGGQGPWVAPSVGEELVAAVFPAACFVALHCLAAQVAGASALPTAAFRVIFFFFFSFFFFHRGDLLIESSFQ